MVPRSRAGHHGGKREGKARDAEGGVCLRYGDISAVCVLLREMDSARRLPYRLAVRYIEKKTLLQFAVMQQGEEKKNTMKDRHTEKEFC